MSSSSSAQTYHTHHRNDALTAVAGSVLLINGLHAYYSVTPSNSWDIKHLTADQLGSFERKAVGSGNKRAGVLSDIGLGLSALTCGALIMTPARKEFKTITLMGYQSLSLSLGLMSLSKGLSNRYRPYVYDQEVHLAQKLHPDARRSFYSGHTTMAATLSFFSASVLHPYLDQDWQKLICWSYAISIPLVVGIARIKANEHFPTDVMAGYISGALIGCVVPYMHRKSRASNNTSLHLMNNRPGLCLRF